VKKILLLFVCASFSFPLWAFDHTHQSYAKVLAAVVVDQGPRAQVNYAWLKEHVFLLDQYLAELQSISLKDYSQWSRNQQMAFLINAYNAFTLKLIVNAYPNLNSIKDLGGLFSSPWQNDFFTLLGQIHNLDSIEHQWLRTRFAEPKVHFAIVCASQGCPALNQAPYIADDLPAQLQSAKTRFLKDTTRNRYDAPTKTLYLSKIFAWFATDFIKAAGSVEAFVADSISQNPMDRQVIQQQGVKIIYLDYDWSLNKIP